MKKLFQILVVEDDANLAKLSIHHLEKFNFSVDWAENGRIAFEMINQKMYDLILTDIMMPEMDGVTFIEKSKPLLKKTPIILLTSAGDKQLVQKAQAFHASAYLLKPVLPPKLLEIVMETLQLEQEDLIEKKKFPLVLESNISGSSAKFRIKGCSDKDFWENLSLQFNGNKNLKNLELNIDEEFAFSRKAYEVLDMYIEKIQNEFGLTLDNIKIIGKFTKTLGKKEWANYKFLGKCIIG
jgi:CheY-like chemotaxis protein